jgi:DMSO/TMAO reductase YedYZ molybdopterin-dependent catalytic subunit
MNDESIVRGRRQLLRGLAAATGAGLLAGCDPLSRSERFVDLLSVAEPVNQHVQRFLTGNRLVREYPRSMISPVFRPNGSTDPQMPEYLALKAGGFSGYRLRLRGLVERPLEFSLDALRALPARTQVTRHDCVEGWSAIGKWRGVRLSALLDLVKPGPTAKYLIFHCADPMEADGTGFYYETIDLEDARHSQTLLAYDLIDAQLPIANGAPLRLRVERQLGYKHAKYVLAIEVVDCFDHIAGGKGGYWEDQGYQWYAGI